VAAIAVVVVDLSALGLLWVEPEFRVGLAPFDVATGNTQHEKSYGDAETRKKAIERHVIRGWRCQRPRQE
jgi:hypothetical protein